MRVVVITPPTPLVSLEEAKGHLRVDGVDDDGLIAAFISAASSHIDGPNGWLGRAIGVQTLEAHVTPTSAHFLQLPYAPIIDVISVFWLDRSGTAVTGDPAQYELVDDTIVSPLPAPWIDRRIGAETLRVRYRAGYAPATVDGQTVSTIPAVVKVSVLLMVGDLYRNRETAGVGKLSAVPMSTTVDALLGPFAGFSLMSFDAGSLDRRIQVQRPVADQSLDGAGSGAWEPVVEVWASVQDMLPSRGERLADGIDIAARPARVRIRWRGGIEASMRVLVGRNLKDGDGNPYWQTDRTAQIITVPAELGRRDGLEFMIEDYTSAGNPA